MYASLNVHTEDTIMAGKQALLDFEQAVKVFIYISYSIFFLSDL